MKRIIRQIFENYGNSILLEEKRFCSIVDDMAPNMLYERKILHNLCGCHMLSKLYFDVFELNSGIPAYLKYTLRLKEEGLSDDWISTIEQMFDFPNSKQVESSSNVSNIKSEAQKFEENCTIILTNTIIGNDSVESNLKNAVKAILISNGVRHIKKGAFSGLPQLEYVYISETVETIGKNVFSDCPKLQFVEIQRQCVYKHMIQISKDIFLNSPQATLVCDAVYQKYCESNKIPFILHEEIELNQNPRANHFISVWHEYFPLLLKKNEVEKKEWIFTPNSVLGTSSDLYYEKYIPKGYREVNVSYIDERKYEYIKSLTIPEGVTAIHGTLKHLYKNGLKKIYIPSSVEQISSDLFDGCEQVSILCPSDAPVRSAIRMAGRKPKSVEKSHFLICESIFDN